METCIPSSKDSEGANNNDPNPFVPCTSLPNFVFGTTALNSAPIASCSTSLIKALSAFLELPNI
jgi:hypothetical protein